MNVESSKRLYFADRENEGEVKRRERSSSFYLVARSRRLISLFICKFTSSLVDLSEAEGSLKDGSLWQIRNWENPSIRTKYVWSFGEQNG
jgi:hypothetical protein